MVNYIQKLNSVKKSDLLKSRNSLSSYSYRQILCPNENVQKLEKFIVANKKGFEPGSKSYIKFTKNYFIRISELSDFDYTFDITSSTLKIIPPEQEKELIQSGDICYQTASNVGNVCVYNGPQAYFNSHIRKLNFNEKEYYIFSFLKSKFGKNQVEVSGSIKGVDNFSNDLLENTIIPFPTKKNHKVPSLIEKYLSILTQNILDKEFQLSRKSKLIDKLFFDELQVSDISKKKKYKLPTISKLKFGNRLDTIIYSERYFNYDSLIKSYESGFYFLNDSEIAPGRTPKDYYYSSTKKSDKFYEWVTPKNVNGRRLDFKTYIHTKSETKIKKNCIVLNGIRYVGNGIYVDSDTKIYSNQNTLIINKFEDKSEQIFLYTFLTSEIGKYMQMAQRNFGIVPILYTENLCKIPIPKLEENIKRKIVKEYYNEISKSTDSNLENYLELEKIRNKSLGIHQLNDEIFNLRSKIELIIDSIIKEKSIEVEL